MGFKALLDCNIAPQKASRIGVYDKNGNTIDTFTKDFSAGNQTITVKDMNNKTQVQISTTNILEEFCKVVDNSKNI